MCYCNKEEWQMLPVELTSQAGVLVRTQALNRARSSHAIAGAAGSTSMSMGYHCCALYDNATTACTVLATVGMV